MEKKHVHLIGIGGIGISALAQLYVHLGHAVSGTNESLSPQTLDRVRALGVPISQTIDVAALPNDVDLFVYSDAWLSREPVFMDAVRALGKTTLSYFEALGLATAEGKSIVISGTHGKTTTTAMLAKVLVDTGHDPTVICGSIMSEYGSNFRAGRPDLFVVEGCEYRRHFLHLHPHILIVNNVELDHTDYYKDLEDMQDAFHTIACAVPPEGAVVTNTDMPTVTAVLHDVVAPVVPYQHVQIPPLQVPGTFNEDNARAAKAAAFALDPELHEMDIDRALRSFKGTWRRFEYKGVTASGAVVYDDYAHHPTAIRSTIEMVRSVYPDKRIVVVFHPHLYSRTRDFMDDFAASLARADDVLLPPIYPAREKPIEGVTSEALVEKVRGLGTSAWAFDSLDAISKHLGAAQNELRSSTVLLTLGAGEAYQVAEALTTHAN